MARKKIVEPFSIFKPSRYNRWIVKFRNKQYSTGLEATPENLAKAKEIGWELHAKYTLHEVPERATQKITFSKAIEHFQDHHANHKAKKTREAYNRAFQIFCPDKTRLLNEQTVLFFIRSALKRHKLGNGWDVYRRAYTKFLTHCVEYKLLPDKITIVNLFPKPNPKKVQVYEVQELSKLFDWCNQNDAELAVLLLVLVSTGLRIHEVLEMKYSDIRNGVLHLTSKDGKRAESVPLAEHVLKALAGIKKQEDKVFRWQPQTVKRVRRKLYKGMEAVGIDRGGRSLHEIRKTFISLMANNDVDVRVASSLARCSIQVMMKHYTILSEKNLKNAIENVASQITPTMSPITPEPNPHLAPT